VVDFELDGATMMYQRLVYTLYAQRDPAGTLDVVRMHRSGHCTKLKPEEVARIELHPAPAEAEAKFWLPDEPVPGMPKRPWNWGMYPKGWKKRDEQSRLADIRSRMGAGDVSW